MWSVECKVKDIPVLLCTTQLAQSTSQYDFVLQSSHKVLPSTTLYYKACTKSFPVLLCTTKLAQSRSQYYFVLYKACTKHFPVLLCTTKLAQSTFQYYFVLQSLHKARSSTTLNYKSCTKHFPVRLCTTKLAQRTSQYYFVLQSLHKALPSTTLYYTACTKRFPVLLCTTKLAQSTSQKALPSTTLYCTIACKKHFPVLLCTTQLAQSTSQYDFVLQSSHKVLPSTTLYYKACTKSFPVLLCSVQSLHKAIRSILLCTTKLLGNLWKGEVLQLPHRHGDASRKPATRDETRGRSKASISCATASNFDTFGTLANRLECHKVPCLPRKTTWQPAWKPSKRRFCSLPHRHGDVSRKPDTRDETRGRSKTSISCETSSNFDTFGNAFGKNLSSALLLDSFQHMTWDLRVHAGTSCKRRQLSMGQEPQEVILFSECFKTKYRFSEGA